MLWSYDWTLFNIFDIYTEAFEVHFYIKIEPFFLTN